MCVTTQISIIEKEMNNIVKSVIVNAFGKLPFHPAALLILSIGQIAQVVN